MKVKAVHAKGDLDELDVDGCDVIVVGYDGETVKYVKELKGETNVLKNLADFSRKNRVCVVYACDTDNYGVVKRSAAVVDDGKLLGISDMTVAFSSSPYAIGANGKLYDLKSGKIAVAICDDLTSFELMRAFAVCGADAVVALQKGKIKETHGILLRAYAYLTGLPFLLVADDGAICSSPSGELVPPSGGNEYELNALADYALKIVKVRSDR